MSHEVHPLERMSGIIKNARMQRRQVTMNLAEAVTWKDQRADTIYHIVSGGIDVNMEKHAWMWGRIV